MRSLDLEAKANLLNLALNGAAVPTPSSPCPSDVKSNLRKGRMWLISDYILNEG